MMTGLIFSACVRNPARLLQFCFNLLKPVGWQFLVGSVLGGIFDSDAIDEYDLLVQSCLSTGAHCIIDIHNYARWDGSIVGQGGPSDETFAFLWSQIATKYANQSDIMFGIMNEPHDIIDINTWSATVQAAVTAIREAGAITQMILLPGNDWTSAGDFVNNGSGAALSAVKNLDGTNTSLIFDVHRYFDSDSSGTHIDCASDHISDSFEPLATWLRE
jgi:endoglucanase